VVARLAALAAVLVLVGAACAAPSPTVPPSPGASQGGSSGDPATSLDPPPGDAVRIDTAAISDDGSTLTVKFVGGKDYDPADPCTNHYFGWARESEGSLRVKVVDDTPVPPPTPTPQIPFACDLVGYGQTIAIRLDRPFLGSRVEDLAGFVHFVRPPDGLATIAVPDGWTEATQRDVEESPTGRWQRTWTKGGAADPGTSKGKVDLYQAFDGPANVTGGDEVRDVQVSGTPAKLYRNTDGELVLVWSLGNDGLALVVNETDVPPDEAIRLAETVRLP
jgi:hypothetical protein